MLKTLEIKNYALITDLRLELEDGLTIITGETGAGKSIIMGALSLLLGERADTKVISDGSRKSVVEACFTKLPGDLRHIFEQNELEWTPDEVFIRREISAAGRSRAFINDTPVNLATLSEVAGKLVDIHSQHSNIKLSDPSEQLAVVDSMGTPEGLLGEYHVLFDKFVSLRQRIKSIKADEAKWRANQEFLRFQKEQLDKLQPREGELPEIEKQYDMLSDADDIRETLGECVSDMKRNDTGLLDTLTDLRELASKIDFSLFGLKEDQDPARRLEEVYVELKDIAETFEDCVGEVDSDPARLAKISARMNLYYDLIKRFRVVNGDELARLHKDIKSKLEAVTGEGDVLSGLEKEARATGAALKDKAMELTGIRKRSAGQLASIINDTARPLGLTNMNFSIELTEGKLTHEGQDRVEFMCAFNKNQTPQPISKVASGGEMSRLMLSLKRIMAERMKLPTVIFDEIDTGVSGEIADKMGEMMRTMSDNLQVLTITHLPQVAAKGRGHLKVYKKDNEERTETNIRRLSAEERIREIAGMLSGSEVNQAALKAARELLK